MIKISLPYTKYLNETAQITLPSPIRKTRKHISVSNSSWVIRYRQYAAAAVANVKPPNTALQVKNVSFSKKKNSIISPNPKHAKSIESITSIKSTNFIFSPLGINFICLAIL